MKNHVIIIGVIVLLLMIFLSGCQEKINDNRNPSNGNQTNNSNHSSNNNKFIGNWKIVESSPDYETWSFYTNGSVQSLLTQQEDNQPITTIFWYDYTIIDNTTVCLLGHPSADVSGTPSPQFLTYSFSNNNTRLTWSLNGIIVKDLVKMP